jgi:hypothetical protein
MPRVNVETLIKEVSEDALKVADAKMDDLSKTIQETKSDSLGNKSDNDIDGSHEQGEDTNGSLQEPAAAIPAPLHTDVGQ